MPNTRLQQRADLLHHYRDHFTVIFAVDARPAPLLPWQPPAPALAQPVRWRVAARIKHAPAEAESDPGAWWSAESAAQAGSMPGGPVQTPPPNVPATDAEPLQALTIGRAQGADGAARFAPLLPEHMTSALPVERAVDVNPPVAPGPLQAPAVASPDWLPTVPPLADLASLPPALARQAGEVDPERQATEGRASHQLRFADLMSLNQRPASPEPTEGRDEASGMGLRSPSPDQQNSVGAAIARSPTPVAPQDAPVDTWTADQVARSESMASPASGAEPVSPVVTSPALETKGAPPLMADSQPSADAGLAPTGLPVPAPAPQVVELPDGQPLPASPDLPPAQTTASVQAHGDGTRQQVAQVVPGTQADAQPAPATPPPAVAKQQTTVEQQAIVPAASGVDQVLQSTADTVPGTTNVASVSPVLTEPPATRPGGSPDAQPLAAEQSVGELLAEATRSDAATDGGSDVSAVPGPAPTEPAAVDMLQGAPQVVSTTEPSATVVPAPLSQNALPPLSTAAEEGPAVGPAANAAQPDLSSYRPVDEAFRAAALRALGPSTPDVPVILPRRARPTPYVPKAKEEVQPAVPEHTADQVQDWLARLNRVAEAAQDSGGVPLGRPLSLAELLSWDQDRPRRQPGDASPAGPAQPDRTPSSDTGAKQSPAAPPMEPARAPANALAAPPAQDEQAILAPPPIRAVARPARPEPPAASVAATTPTPELSPAPGGDREVLAQPATADRSGPAASVDQPPESPLNRQPPEGDGVQAAPFTPSEQRPRPEAEGPLSESGVGEPTRSSAAGRPPTPGPEVMDLRAEGPGEPAGPSDADETAQTIQPHAGQESSRLGSDEAAPAPATPAYFSAYPQPEAHPVANGAEVEDLLARATAAPGDVPSTEDAPIKAESAPLGTGSAEEPAPISEARAAPGEIEGPPADFLTYRPVDEAFRAAALRALGPSTPDVPVILPRRARPTPYVPKAKEEVQPAVPEHTADQVQDWLARLNRVAEAAQDSGGVPLGRPLSLAELLSWDQDHPRGTTQGAPAPEVAEAGAAGPASLPEPSVPSPEAPMPALAREQAAPALPGRTAPPSNKQDQSSQPSPSSAEERRADQGFPSAPPAASGAPQARVTQAPGLADDRALPSSVRPSDLGREDAGAGESRLPEAGPGAGGRSPKNSGGADGGQGAAPDAPTLLAQAVAPVTTPGTPGPSPAPPGRPQADSFPATASRAGEARLQAQQSQAGVAPGVLRVTSRPKLERALTEPAAREPLPLQARAQLAPLLGTDVGNVQLDRSPRAADAVAEAGADALAVGDTVLLGPGQDLSSPASLGLLAHELTHVLRDRDPGFLPASVRQQSGSARLDEETLAERVEGRVRDVLRAREKVRPSPAGPKGAPPRSAPTPSAQTDWQAEWGGLPHPSEPLPHWETPAAQPQPLAARSTAPAAPVAPVVTARPASSASAPTVRAAELSRSVPSASTTSGDSAPPAAKGPAVGADHQRANRGGPDLDRLARQIYSILKRRLSDEMRRLR